MAFTYALQFRDKFCFLLSQNQSFGLPLNMPHIVPHKLTTHPTFGLFASGHPRAHPVKMANAVNAPLS